MERWWGKAYDRAAIAGLYGDLGENALAAAIARGKPHEQITAAAALGERGRPGDARAIVPVLASDYPLARYWARQAIEELVRRPLPFDLDGDVAAVPAEARAWVEEAIGPRRR